MDKCEDPARKTYYKSAEMFMKKIDKRSRVASQGVDETEGMDYLPMFPQVESERMFSPAE